jgi:hypothetical protein
MISDDATLRAEMIVSRWVVSHRPGLKSPARKALIAETLDYLLRELIELQPDRPPPLVPAALVRSAWKKWRAARFSSALLK